MESKTRIKGNVHYVGVNDRNKHRFEAMWPLPYGVSYNSYLIDDEMVALVDTVDICYFEVYLRKIKQVIGERPINYLIINHMEPDHSGSIRLIKQHYPEIIIVGNKQTFGMIEGFYGVTGEQYLVKDGDFLALGRHKLRFYMTPMVHWPETMMTFDETDGVLFSGDGFGCFGTVDGGFLDTRINVDKYWGEMVRYYSNIVGKYGSSVQKALQKLGGLPISAICSTHGPVWTENIAKVIGIYDRLSRYDADEGVVIAYGSMYGNTEQMAEAIAEELSAQGVKNIVMHNVTKSHPSYIIADIFRYKGLIIGSPTYSNQIFPEVEALLSKILLREVKGRYLGYFGSFAWAGAAVKRLAEFAEKSKFELIGDPVEMKQAMKGIEATLNGTPVKTKDFSLSLSANIAYNKNKVTKYKASYSSMGYNNLWEGYPVDAIYSGRYTGIDPETGLYTYQLRPDAEIHTATDLNKPDNYRYYLGTSEAPVTGGFNVTAEYKGIRLSVNGTFATGAKNFEFIKSPTSANTVSGNGVFNYTEREQVFQNDLFAHHLNVPIPRDAAKNAAALHIGRRSRRR